MSTDFVSDKHIPFSRLKKFNYSGVKVDEITEYGHVILSDGKNCLWACPNTDFESISLKSGNPEFETSFHYEGVVFTRYGTNEPDLIIDALEAFFDVRLISEHEEEYDGDNREEEGGRP
jgi:hypothetical protein